MPAFNFKREFKEKILNGEKPFTLRIPREDGRDPVVGKRLYFFTGMRTKKCERFANTFCMFTCDVTVTRRSIFAAQLTNDFCGILTNRQEENFARLDGFKSADEFRRFHLDGKDDKKLKLIAWVNKPELINRLGL